MRCDVLTLFPEIIRAYTGESILKRAIDKGLLEVGIYNIRDFAHDKHKVVDDYPYGGGAGMVLKPEPVFKAVQGIEQDGEKRRRILLCPTGRLFNYNTALEFSRERQRLLFICGHYEGIDERVKMLVDDEISIGDFVLTGGELAALVIIDASVRFIEGVLGDERSAIEDSFSWGLLDYPHYTRPGEFMGMKVPDVLLSGNHRQIWLWRRKEALRLTLRRRPELLEKIKLSDEDKRLISEIKEES